MIDSLKVKNTAIRSHENISSLNNNTNKLIISRVTHLLNKTYTNPKDTTTTGKVSNIKNTKKNIIMNNQGSRNILLNSMTMLNKPSLSSTRRKLTLTIKARIIDFNLYTNQASNLVILTMVSITPSKTSNTKMSPHSSKLALLSFTLRVIATKVAASQTITCKVVNLILFKPVYHSNPISSNLLLLFF